MAMDRAPTFQGSVPEAGARAAVTAQYAAAVMGAGPESLLVRDPVFTNEPAFAFAPQCARESADASHKRAEGLPQAAVEHPGAPETLPASDAPSALSAAMDAALTEDAHERDASVDGPALLEQPVSAVLEQPVSASLEEQPVSSSLEEPVLAPLEQPISSSLEQPVSAASEQPVSASHEPETTAAATDSRPVTAAPLPPVPAQGPLMPGPEAPTKNGDAARPPMAPALPDPLGATPDRVQGPTARPPTGFTTPPSQRRRSLAEEMESAASGDMRRAALRGAADSPLG